MLAEPLIYFFNDVYFSQMNANASRLISCYELLFF